MKIRPMGAELFDADRRTDGRTDRHDETNSRLFAVSRTSLKTGINHAIFETNLAK